VHLRNGDPAREVSALAESVGADLLVIGRGPRDREGGRLPKNAYAIIRQSPCVVLSV
jgi:nucleotide-binding universal stress UspA family protein